MPDIAWRNSYSGDGGNNCVEVGVWRRSSYSGPNNNCVEVAAAPHAVLVRDSKDPYGGRLDFSVAQWATFTASVRAGHFDL